MSIIQRLKSEIDQFDSEAKDELYRFLEFLRVRNATDPLPVLTAPAPEPTPAAPEPTPVAPEPTPAEDPGTP